ncbi:MAG: Fis family transcriptional regulator [Dermatophilaceae bacterium]|nr:Fis family transcriptional regulator [Dermatophilaceae bacterium]
MVPTVEGALPERWALQGSPDGAARVSGRVIASWQRSEDYGVPLESVEPFFAGTRHVDSLFFQCGREVLTGLHETLANEPISLMLTDADGLVLNRLSGDTSLLRALDAVHLAPGFAFSEREAGTNGLGMALADRTPSLVRADEHYSLSLCTYTCAAAPVVDPVTGRLEGSVNLTTWSRSRGDLLLALAQSAAGNTASLMLARSRGQTPRAAPRGQVFRVETARLEPGSGTLRGLSTAWREAVDRAADAISRGRVVAAVGEVGAGRATLLAQALRQAHPRDRILSVSSPDPEDVDAWLSSWAPEISKPWTSVVVRNVDVLPAVAAASLVGAVGGRRTGTGSPSDGRDGEQSRSWCLTAESFAHVPPGLGPLVDTVVEVPPLRERTEDVMPLARHVAERTRGRPIDFTAAAERALTGCGWPGNVDQLVRTVRQAAGRGDVVDLAQLPSEVMSGSRRRLTRIEAFERDEIVRCLTRPGTTMKMAATELGMSRATLYRKLAQYELHALKE